MIKTTCKKLILLFSFITKDLFTLPTILLTRKSKKLKGLPCPVFFIIPIIIICFSCSSSSRIDNVIKGFFEEVNKGNFETAKAKYLSTRATNALNSILAMGNDPMQKSFKDYIGKIKSVNIQDIKIAGEIAEASAIIPYHCGKRLSSKIRLIKEGGKKWKIDDCDDFITIGQDHVDTAESYCRTGGLGILYGWIKPNKEEVAKAIGEFQLALKDNPEDANIMEKFGKCYLKLENFNASEEQFKKAIEICPDSIWEAYIGLAKIYEKNNNINEAEQALMHAIKNKSDDANIYLYLVNIRSKDDKNLDKAIEAALKALSLSPEDAKIMDTIGMIYYKKGDRAHALEYLDRAIKINPYDRDIQKHHSIASETAKMHISKAQAFLKKNEPDMAIKECEAALQLERNNNEAKILKQESISASIKLHLSQAQSFFNKQYYDKAIEECNIVLKYDANNQDAMILKNRISEVKKILSNK